MTLKSTRIYGIMGTNFSGKMARPRQIYFSLFLILECVLQGNLLSTGCPRKSETDLNNSNGSCLILISKQLFLLKSKTIRINFDTFSSSFGDLVVKLKISKVQNCFQVKTRAAALAIVD